MIMAILFHSQVDPFFLFVPPLVLKPGRHRQRRQPRRPGRRRRGRRRQRPGRPGAAGGAAAAAGAQRVRRPDPHGGGAGHHWGRAAGQVGAMASKKASKKRGRRWRNPTKLAELHGLMVNW